MCSSAHKYITTGAGVTVPSGFHTSNGKPLQSRTSDGGACKELQVRAGSTAQLQVAPHTLDDLAGNRKTKATAFRGLAFLLVGW